MSELREAAKAALNQWDKVSGVFRMTAETEALRAALAEPKTELRDQHKAFAEWFLQQNPIAPNVEDMAWAAWKAALAQPETEAGVSWGGHNVRGDADSIAEVRRLIDFEQARQGTKPATGGDLRVYDAIAANYNAQPEPEAPRDEWRLASEPPDSTRSVLIWLRFGDVETFGKTLGGPHGFAFQNGAITHWRDVSPPAENQR